MSALLILALTVLGGIAGAVIGSAQARGSDDLGFGEAIYGMYGMIIGGLVGLAVSTVIVLII